MTELAGAQRGATAAPPIEMLGSFESTYQPGHDTDVAETTGHADMWRSDLDLLRTCGIRRLRYPVRWHRIEATEGRFDWSHTDEVFDHVLQAGLAPIVDLVHHTSYPRWLTDGFADRRFARAFLRYLEAFAARYPWVAEYTVFNEPFSTLLLCGNEGVWPPYHRGPDAFIRLLRNTLPALSEGSRLFRDMLPGARHVYVDSCEQHTGDGAAGSRYAAYANDRRFFVLDALLGRVDDGTPRPFVDEVLRHGGRSLLELDPASVDVLGLDYYAHCQWHFGERPMVPSPHPAPLAALIECYATRYGLPCMLTETNLRGYPSDRASWLKYTLEQCELSVRAGVRARGLLLVSVRGLLRLGLAALPRRGERRPGRRLLDRPGPHAARLSDVGRLRHGGARRAGRGASGLPPARACPHVAAGIRAAADPLELERASRGPVDHRLRAGRRGVRTLADPRLGVISRACRSGGSAWTSRTPSSASGVERPTRSVDGMWDVDPVTTGE